VCAAVIGGDFTRSYGEAMAAKQSLRKTMDEERVKGFVDILVARNITEGLSNL
jgi:potassium/chloride transporter 4/5/6